MKLFLRLGLIGLLPLTAACAPLPHVGDRAVPNAFFVFFDSGSASPAEGSDAVLREAAAFARAHDTLQFKVVGHRAKAEKDDALDIARAVAVGARLETAGVASDRMVVVGMGHAESIAAAAGNDPAADRRVDILVSLGGK